MTVKELHKELSLLIEQGHADTRVTANVNFKSPWDLKKVKKLEIFGLDIWIGYIIKAVILNCSFQTKRRVNK